MPRRPLPPRLYLRKDRNGTKTWIIRDNNRDARTGFREHQKSEAEALLADYRAGRFRPVREKPAGFIYFVTCLSSEHYPIKIGWSNTPMEARVAQLQNGNPNLLTVVGTLSGSIEDERRLHLYFAHLRIRGEWFLRNGELIDYIGGLAGQVETYGVDAFAPGDEGSNARARLETLSVATNPEQNSGKSGNRDETNG